MNVTAEDARPDHLPPILDDIRDADYREWYASTGSVDIEQCLVHVWDAGSYARAAVDEDGRCLAMWGMDDNGDGSANCWMFGTERGLQYSLKLQRLIRSEFPPVLERWPTLYAYSDSRNTVHHMWLEWLKFDLEREVHLKPFGLPFRKYVRRRT